MPQLEMEEGAQISYLQGVMTPLTLQQAPDPSIRQSSEDMTRFYHK